MGSQNCNLESIIDLYHLIVEKFLFVLGMQMIGSMFIFLRLLFSLYLFFSLNKESLSLVALFILYNVSIFYLARALSTFLILFISLWFYWLMVNNLLLEWDDLSVTLDSLLSIFYNYLCFEFNTLLISYLDVLNEWGRWYCFKIEFCNKLLWWAISFIF